MRRAVTVDEIPVEFNAKARGIEPGQTINPGAPGGVIVCSRTPRLGTAQKAHDRKLKNNVSLLSWHAVITP